MTGIFLSRLIEFAIQTAVLLGLLWGMVKIQKLDQHATYRFLWLLGAAALATGLDMIPYAGHYLAVAALFLCIKKTTGAPHIDALFTVAISYALMFGVNLFILGSLIGGLRPSARNSEEFEIVTQQQEIKKEHPTTVKTNLPAQKTNLSAPNAPAKSTKPAEKAGPKTNPPATSAPTNATKPAKGAAPMTNLPAPGTATNLVKPPEAAALKTNQPAQSVATNAVSPGPAKPVEVIAKYFTIKGVTRNAAKSAVTIQIKAKIYTVFLDETASMQTPDGPIPVRFIDLGEDWVVLEINGEPIKFLIH